MCYLDPLSVNIVFDLGGVVFNWQPDRLIKNVFDEPEIQAVVRKEILDHPDWVELDRGTLPVEQAIARGAARTGLPSVAVQGLLDEVPKSLTPIHETVKLIRRLSNTTNRLFVLSNMHRASIVHLEQTYDFWSLFDGIVISSRIQKVKPEIDIYEYLLDAHQLEPGETVFIDDTRENLTAAASIGIRTIEFTEASTCLQTLTDLGCI